MGERTRRRPSAAMIVACIALSIAIGGGAYAAGLAKNSVGSKQVKNGSLKGKDMKDDKVTGKQVDESSLGQVPSAASADNAANATSATSADTAAAADTPTVWAHVHGNGTLLDGDGVSSGNVTKATSYYCFSGLPFTPRSAVATTDYWNGTPTFSTILQFGLGADGLGGTGCPPGTQAFVKGHNANTNVAGNVGFHIAFIK